MSPADHADNRRQTQKQQNNINQTVFLCDIMQLCCIPLRDLRYLRENTRKSTQSIGTEETHVSPADLADYRRQTTKQH